jgi:hypothetical protein
LLDTVLVCVLQEGKSTHAVVLSGPWPVCKLPTVVWLVNASTPFSMSVHQKLVPNPHNKAEAKKGIPWPLTSSQ